VLLRQALVLQPEARRCRKGEEISAVLETPCREERERQEAEQDSGKAPNDSNPILVTFSSEHGAHHLGGRVFVWFNGCYFGSLLDFAGLGTELKEQLL
jgi:hypothetical protein